MSVHRRRPDFTLNDETFHEAMDLIGRAGVQEMAYRWSIRTGDVYTMPVIVTGWVLLAFLRRAIGHAELMHLFWDVLTASQREALGLPSECDKLSSARGWSNEYQRLFESSNRLADALTPVVMPRNRRISQAEFDRYHRDALKDPESPVRRGRLLSLANALIMASVPQAHLSAWDGSILVDDHQLVLARSDGSWSRSARNEPRLRPAVPFVGLTNQSRKANWAWALAVSFAKPVHTVEGDYVPEVILGLSFGLPGSQTTDRTLECVDALMLNDAFPRRPRYRPVFIGDQGFNHHGIAEGLTDRGFDVVREHAQRTPPAPTALQHGVHLINGRPFCIGGRKLALGLRPMKNEATSSDDELLAHHEMVQRVRAGEMPVHEPPTRMLRRQPGRPRDGAEHQYAYRMTLVSPCRAGNFCAFGNPSDAGRGLPEVAHPPTGPKEDAPATCSQAYTTVWLDGDQLRKYQAELYGSFEHDDRYGNARPRDERGQGRVVSKHAGDLNLEKVQAWSLPMLVIATAACVVAANRATVVAWTRDRALGRPQPGSLGARRQGRRARLQRARDARESRRLRR